MTTRFWLILTVAGMCAAAAIGVALKRAAPTPTTAAPQPVQQWRPAPTQPRVLAQTAELGPVFDTNRPQKERLQPFLDGAIPPVAPTDLPLLRAIIINPNESETLRNEVLNLLRREGDQEFILSAEAVLDNPLETDRFRAFVVQHLEAWRHDKRASADMRTTISNRLVALLDDPGLATRREAMWALGKSGEQAALQRAQAVLGSGEPEAELDLAIRIIREHAVQEAIPDLRLASSHENIPIQIAAIEALGFLGDVASRAVFVRASNSRHQQVAAAGRLALQRLDEE